MACLVKDIGWHELICHTNFSFLVGASHPHEIVNGAAEHGYKRIAITDYDGVYGLARSYRALLQMQKKHADNGLGMICGAELHLDKDHHKPILVQDTLVLLAQNHTGYFNLCRLASYGHRDGKINPNVPLDYLLQSDVTGLVAIVPMRGLIHHHWGDVAYDALEQRVARLRDHFQHRIAMAITRTLNAAEDRAVMPTVQMAQRLAIPCVISQDAFFHDKQQKDISDVLHAIRHNLTVQQAMPHVFVNGERSLHALDVIEARYRVLPCYASALVTARNIAESCTFQLNELRYRYPKEMLPEGMDAQTYLEQITWQHAIALYRHVPDKVGDLLTHELALIKHLGFADYFLTVWDIVRWARERGILCQGRGSAANSAVCFVLGITSVDPSAFDVLFERFISVERGDPPDIDVDFEHERREEVIQYVYARYGRDKAAMVANVITFQRKGSIRAAGKALGISADVLAHASQLLTSQHEKKRSDAATLQEIVVGKDGDANANGALPWDLWRRIADRLYGFPRHLGIHSGGFMVADKSLDWLVAQEPATMPGRTVIQWCKEDIEALGFFKIDVLALGILTALRKCFALLASHYQRPMTLATVPSDDTPTYDMMCRADTAGTFQIESRAQMSMLPRMQPRCFYDLVIEVAIIRPGPIQGKMIHPYLRRRHGEEAVTFPDARLRPILQRTLGIPIFQEQVMRVAMAVGGFTPGEADELRKNIGAFSIRGNVEKWIDKLEAGMRRNGIAEAFIHTILQQMHGFAHYGFPESHSVSFARLAYASCYLKCHYPAAYFVALLNSQPMGFYAPHVLIQTVRHAGVTVLPICAASSQWDATLEIVPGTRTYGIRLGLRLVRSLRVSAAHRMVEKRTAVGGWKSVLHMLQTSDMSRTDLAALAAADALSVFGLDRRSAIWLTEAAPYCHYLHNADPADTVAFQPETQTERVQADFVATTTSLGPHPAEIMRQEAWCFPVDPTKLIQAHALASLVTNRIVMVFGMVIVRQAPPSAHGMVFMTLEDESGLLNLALTPHTYNTYRQLIDGQAFLCVQGRLQRKNTAHSILVKKVIAPLFSNTYGGGHPLASVPARVGQLSQISAIPS